MFWRCPGPFLLLLPIQRLYSPSLLLIPGLWVLQGTNLSSFGSTMMSPAGSWYQLPGIPAALAPMPWQSLLWGSSPEQMAPKASVVQTEGWLFNSYLKIICVSLAPTNVGISAVNEAWQGAQLLDRLQRGLGNCMMLCRNVSLHVIYVPPARNRWEANIRAVFYRVFKEINKLIMLFSVRISERNKPLFQVHPRTEVSSGFPLIAVKLWKQSLSTCLVTLQGYTFMLTHTGLGQTVLSARVSWSMPWHNQQSPQGLDFW